MAIVSIGWPDCFCKLFTFHGRCSVLMRFGLPSEPRSEHFFRALTNAGESSIRSYAVEGRDPRPPEQEDVPGYSSTTSRGGTSLLTSIGADPKMRLAPTREKPIDSYTHAT